MQDNNMHYKFRLQRDMQLKILSREL